MDEEFCNAMARQWAVFPELARAYLEYVDRNRYFATSFMCPVVGMASAAGPVSGMLVAISTAESTRVHKENALEHSAGRGIRNPHWQYLQVYFFKDLAFLNFSGMHDEQYGGYPLPVLFGEYLKQACIAKGIEYADKPVFEGPVLSPLRAMLQELGTPIWAEITAGSSFHEYRALDAYVRVFGMGIESAEQEAMFILNTEAAARNRRLKYPEEWWTCDSWVSKGQKWVVAEWNLKYISRAVVEVTDPNLAGKFVLAKPFKPLSKL